MEISLGNEVLKVVRSGKGFLGDARSPPAGELAQFSAKFCQSFALTNQAILPRSAPKKPFPSLKICLAQLLLKIIFRAL